MKRVTWAHIYNSENISNNSSIEQQDVMVKDEDGKNEHIFSENFGIVQLFNELEDLNYPEEDLNTDNSWETVSESSFDSHAKEKYLDENVTCMFEMNENDPISIVPFDNHCYSGSILAVPYNSQPICFESDSSNEFMLQDLDNNGESWRISSNLNELEEIPCEIIENTICSDKDGTTYCSNEILVEELQHQHIIDKSLLDPDVILDDKTENEVPIKNLIDSDSVNNVDRAHFECTGHISKSTSNGKLMPKINYPGGCLSSVAYVILKREEFSMAGIHAKNNEVGLLSEIRNKQIKVSAYNCEQIESPSSLLHKYIYIEKPVNLFSKNKFDNIQPQIFECHMMSIEHKSKSNHEPEENKNNVINYPETCSSNCTEKEVQDTTREISTHCVKCSQAGESSLNDRSTWEADIPLRQSLTQAISSQTYSSPDKTENWLLNSNCKAHIHEIIHNDLCNIMEKCNEQPITLPDTMNYAPVTVFIGDVENPHQSLDSTQQSMRKEGLVIIYQEENNEEQLQERETEIQQGCSFLLSDNNIVPCVQYEDIKSMCSSQNVLDLMRNNEYYAPDSSKEEISGRNNFGENSNCRKEPLMASEEDLLDVCGCKASYPFPNNDQKQEIEYPPNFPPKQVDMETKSKTMEHFIKELSLEDSMPEKDKVTELSAKRYQEQSSRRLTILEKIFPNTSIQYSMLILKEAHANLLDVKKIMIQSETSVKSAITQYVRDKNLENQLLKNLEEYSQKQIKGEQRLHSIAHHLIEEQLQIIKNFKDSSQAHIEMLINQKNMVEQENMLLLKKLEKLHVKLKQSPHAEIQILDSNCNLLENNEKLRSKLTFAQRNVFEQHIVHQEMLEQLELCADEMQKQKLEIERQKCKRSSIYSDTILLNFIHDKEFSRNLLVVIQIRNQKDFDIEKAHLCTQLEKYKNSIKDATDSADAILESMTSLQTNFGESGRKFLMNGEKWKVEGTSVVDVLNMCRSFLYELTLEAANLHQELTAKEKEISTLKESNEQMQHVLSELETEYNMLRQQSEQVMGEKIDVEKQLIKRTQENSDLKDQVSKCMQNKKLLEMESNELQDLKRAAKDHEILKSQLEKYVEELKTDKENMLQKLLSDEKTGRTMEVDLMKMTTLLDMYETQNKELINAKQNLEEQLENIKKLYFSLQNLPQQYEQLEKSYFKEIAEKDYINQQLNSMQAQLSEYSDIKAEHSKQMQNLESEFKKISKDNLEMRWELKNLKNINQCLEHDNCDMLHRLEEESARQKCQITESHSKTHELQSLIETKEKEIEELKNMFIMQSETMYSLQQECEEKKDIICKLEEKCQDLNNLQQKDKNEVCILKNKIQELENQITAVSNSNKVTLNSIRYEFEALEATLKITQDDLNNSVIQLQEKETTLISFRENLHTAEHRLVEKEHQIADNLRTIEMLQNDLQEASEVKNKYTEMQELLKDHKNTIQERDKLKEDLENLQLKTETLQKDFKELQNKNDTLIKFCTLQKEHIKGMKAQINKLQDYLTKADIRNRENIEMDLHQITCDLALHNNKAAELEYEIEEYKFILDEKQNGNEEKCRLQSQVMLLHELFKRNNNDLKQARKTIKIQEDKITELMTQMNEESSKQRKTVTELEAMTEQHESFLVEMENLKERVQLETQNCLSLTEEYYNYQKEMSEKEAKFLSNIKELNNKIKIMQEEITETNNEKDDIKQILENKQKDESLLKKRNEEMESRLSDYGRTLSHLAQEKRKNEQLENQLQVLADEGRNLIHLQHLLQKQNTDVTTALEDSRDEFKRTKEALSALEQLEKQHAAELQNTKEEHLQENSRHLEEIKLMEKNKSQSEQAIKELMETEECLLRHKRKLSLKLLKALKIIHQTKLKYKLANEKIQDLSSQTNNLREQKALKEAEVVTLSSEIAELNMQVQQKNTESENQSSAQKFQQHICNLEQHVDELQLQLLKAKQKIHNENFKTEALLLIKEDIILQSKEQINLLQDKSNRLCTRLAEAQSKILQQNQEQSKLKRDMVTLQAEKRELSLQLKVMEGYFNEEKQHRIHLEETYNKLSEKLNSGLKP